MATIKLTQEIMEAMTLLLSGRDFVTIPSGSKDFFIDAGYDVAETIPGSGWLAATHKSFKTVTVKTVEFQSKPSEKARFYHDKIMRNQEIDWINWG